MKKLLGIVVLGLLWFNAGNAEINEPGNDKKCFYVFEKAKVFERKFLPKAKERALGGVLVTYVGCNKYYDDWSWDYSTFPAIDVAHQKAYDGCTKTEMPKYNLTGCHLFSIDDVIVWGKDVAFVTKVEKDIKIRLAKISSKKKKAALLYVEDKRKYAFYNVTHDMDHAFTSRDPTTFKKLTFKKKRNFRTSVPIGKHARGGLKLGPRNIKGFSYIAEYEDNIKTEIIVETNKKLKKMGKEVQMNVAKKKALYFAKIFGQMPYFIKKVNRKIIVHKKDKKTRSSGGWVAWKKLNEFHIVENPRCYNYLNNSVSYSDTCFNGDALIMLHELAHVVQRHTNIITPSKWVKAKNLDEKYCSKYAMTNDKEDFAESVVCWVGVRYKSHKISPKNVKTINLFIPSRIKFFDDLNLNVYPLK
jgi:hypothetical protein